MKEPAFGNLKLWHKGLILVLLPLIFEAAFLVALAQLLNQAEADIRRQYHAQLLLARVGNLSKLTLDAAASLAAAAAGKSGFNSEQFSFILEQIKTESQTLRQMHAQDRIEEQALQKISILAEEELQFAVHAALQLQKQSDGLLLIEDEALRELGASISLRLMSEIKQLSQYESSVKRSSSDVRRYVWFWLLGGLLLNVLAAVALTIYFSQQFVRRIGIIALNSKRMAASQSLAPPLSGSDEIAYVDRSFHDMADKLQAANQAKQQFVAMITHDLRSPLTSIRLILDLLAIGALGELTKQAGTRVEQALASCDRLLALINDLLDIDKLEAGKMDMDFARVKIDSIIARSVEALDRLAESHEIELLSETTSLEVMADESRLIQVLVNLISNAIKFSEKKSQVFVSAFASENNFVEFQVKDSGRGIPKDMQEKIFDRFSQVEIADASQKGGSGLGLAICKAIIQEHKGEIGVICGDSAGSTFWFKIPLAQPENESSGSGQN